MYRLRSRQCDIHELRSSHSPDLRFAYFWRRENSSDILLAYFSGRTQRIKLWMDPRYGVPIKKEEVVRNQRGIVRSDRTELAAIKAERS